MKNENSFLLILIVISLFYFTRHECRGISKRQSVQNSSSYWGWGDLHWPYGTSRWPILRNPFLSHAGFPLLWGAVDPVAPSLDTPVDQVTFQPKLSIDDLNQLNSTRIFEDDILIKGTPEGMAPSAVYSNYLWPGGKIPYIISDGYDQKEKNVILNAMKTIEQKTCIQYIPRTNEEDYINIHNGKDGCKSYMGRVGGGQELWLDDDNGCVTSAVVKHELMHAIGFWHEHCRTDRDDYVIVHFDNIKSEHRRHFEKQGAATIQLLNTPYDINSIMHYASNAMALDPTKPTITAKNGDRITPSDDFTEIDILDINRLYGCNQEISKPIIWYDANYENNVQLKWARGCDFNGNDFRHVTSTAEDCGGHCVADSRCTHFTHRDWGVCYLKIGPKSFNSIPMQGAVCGFIHRRDPEVESTTDEFYWYDANYENKAQLKWARGCDFNGNDFHRVESSAEDCGGHCVADSRCTHFTYSYDGNHFCYLKTAPKSFKPSPFQGAVCGYITRRESSTDSKFITTTICENNANKIACPSKIFIVKARYGRYSKDTCKGQNDHLKCDKDVLEIISKLCNGKTNCNLKVTNELMGGDPGYGIHKYLEVQYYCY